MRQKLTLGMKCVFFSIFAISCTGFPSVNSGNPDIGTGQNGQASGTLFTGNGGRGLVIAVPARIMSVQEWNEWLKNQ